MIKNSKIDFYLVDVVLGLLLRVYNNVYNRPPRKHGGGGLISGNHNADQFEVL